MVIATYLCIGSLIISYIFWIISVIALCMNPNPSDMAKGAVYAVSFIVVFCTIVVFLMQILYHWMRFI